MLSLETPSYDKVGTDPRLVAFARRPFSWEMKKTVEIPLGLITGRVDADVQTWCLDVSDTKGRNGGFLTWFSLPYPHEHLHIDFTFTHRPLQRQAVTYGEAEGVCLIDYHLLIEIR